MKKKNDILEKNRMESQILNNLFLIKLETNGNNSSLLEKIAEKRKYDCLLIVDEEEGLFHIFNVANKVYFNFKEIGDKSANNERIFPKLDKLVNILIKYYRNHKTIGIIDKMLSQVGETICVAFLLKISELKVYEIIDFMRTKNGDLFYPYIDYEKALREYQFSYLGIQ